MPDLPLILIELLFGVLFVWALWTAIRHRSALARDVTLVFVPLAALMAGTLATQLLEALGAEEATLPTWVGIAVVTLLLLQPVFSLKLVADLREIPRWLLPATLAGVVATTALFVATQPTPPTWILFAVVGVFIAGQVVAAMYLLDEARHRTGGARIRLMLASAATAAIGLALFGSVAANAAGVAADVTDLGVRGLALIAAIAFWIAFLPPRWLRNVWLATSASAHSDRLMAASPSALPAELWDDLATTTHRLTGAGAVVLVAGADAALRVVAASGTETGEIPDYALDELAPLVGNDGGGHVGADLRARSGCDFLAVVPMQRDGQAVGAVCLLRSRASLFDTDDAALVSRLAGRAAYLVQRREVLAEEQRLTEQLRVTVDALESASAAKSDFLASMSHELRTPLNAIIGFSELMVADDDGSEMLSVPREWVDHIRNGGSHLVSLINDVLDLAKIEAGRLELVKVPVDVGHAVAESVGGLRPLADRKRITLAIDAPSLFVEVDAGRLRQILYNLLSNAIKYTGDGGEIRAEVRGDQRDVWIAVRDTGVGISEEDQRHVFEEFRQVGDPTKRMAGTGLGLALTRRLVEAHGGTIGLESEPGVGSTFTVRLPIGAPEVPDAPSRAPALDAGRGARVLIIEDDPSSVRLLQTYLADSGYRVSVASDGERGLQMAMADPPAAILLDVLLPRIDGWEVLRRLKSEPSIRDVPVVIVTVVDERNVGLALGAVDYFVKPIEREALLARLDRHMFLARARQRSLDILAIDDDPVSLDMIDATLAPYGFAIHRARSGQEGLHLVDAVHPDLVICDLLMPGVDGFEVVGRLQADRATADIPILVLTGHELSAADKARLNGRILGVVEKGATAGNGLRDWLSRVVPELVPVSES